MDPVRGASRIFFLLYFWRMKFLIVGLGNIGPQYELTRHNIGFLTLDRMADLHKVAFHTERLADVADLRFKGKHIHLIKPNTYMNLSGKAVAYWMQALKIPKENVLVVVDDLALPFGTLRMRTQGSSAGHNGLGHIEETLGSKDYPRLRMGIGSQFARGQQVDYVLSNFNTDELKSLPDYMDKAIDAILAFCTIGPERAMNLHNTKPSRQAPE
jgi:PTH1 family peptidyl-tRNA hydrolase